MIVLDTNVLIRYFTGDNPDHTERATALLKRVQSGEMNVVLPESVVAETVYVLSSRLYNFTRAEIRERLSDLLSLESVRASDNATLIEALDVYTEYPRLAFVDALCVAYALSEPDSTLLSFDRGMRNIRGLQWEEP